MKISSKMPLPDETLDAISGGVLTFGGNPITEIVIGEYEGETGMAFSTVTGDYFVAFDAMTQADIKENPAVLDSICKDLSSMQQSDKIITLETYQS